MVEPISGDHLSSQRKWSEMRGWSPKTGYLIAYQFWPRFWDWEGGHQRHWSPKKDSTPCFPALIIRIIPYLINGKPAIIQEVLHLHFNTSLITYGFGAERLIQVHQWLIIYGNFCPFLMSHISWLYPITSRLTDPKKTKFFLFTVKGSSVKTFKLLIWCTWIIWRQFWQEIWLLDGFIFHASHSLS